MHTAGSRGQEERAFKVGAAVSILMYWWPFQGMNDFHNLSAKRKTNKQAFVRHTFHLCQDSVYGTQTKVVAVLPVAASLHYIAEWGKKKKKKYSCVYVVLSWVPQSKATVFEIKDNMQKHKHRRPQAHVMSALLYLFLSNTRGIQFWHFVCITWGVGRLVEFSKARKWELLH